MDVSQLHYHLIILHAFSGTISFFAGCALVLLPKYLANKRLFALYFWSLVGLIVFLAGAMIAHWMHYSNPERIIFTGLFGLGIYMLYRAQNASRLLKSQQNNWKHSYIDHIGFTLISLFEGFIIVTVLSAGGPGWLVAILAILGVLIGRWAIDLAQRRVA